MGAPAQRNVAEHLPERLVGLDLCSIAVWVFDNERGRLPWANKEALKLFNAATRSELAARDMSDFSAASHARFVHIRSEFSAGRDVWETWTLYPKGEPKKIKLHLAPFALADGRIIYLAEAFPIENPEIPADSRGIEALRHTAAMVTMLDSTGAIVLKNPAAVRAFEATPFSTWFTDSAINATISAVLAFGGKAGHEWNPARAGEAFGQCRHRAERSGGLPRPAASDCPLYCPRIIAFADKASAKPTGSAWVWL